MRAFNYDSFADLSRVFDLTKGQVVPPAPKARVILYTSTTVSPALAQSRFVDVKALRPQVKPLFITASRKLVVAAPVPPVAQPVITVDVQPIVTTIQPVADLAPTTITLDTPANSNNAQLLEQLRQMAAEITAKPETAAPTPKRGTLRLKSKVELPPTITRRSTVYDLAAAFKAEMAIAEKKAQEDISLEDVMPRRAPHPKSNKSWSELFAEVEAMEAQKPRKDFDLGSAFKAEMKAFAAEQAKLESVPVAALVTAAKPKTTPLRPRAAMKLAA